MEQNPSNVYYGWVCPFCLTVYAPLVKSCNCQTSIKPQSTVVGASISLDPGFMVKTVNQYREGNT